MANHNSSESPGPNTETGFAGRARAQALLAELGGEPEGGEQGAERLYQVHGGAATYCPKGPEHNEDRLRWSGARAVLADGVGSMDNSAPAADLAAQHLYGALDGLAGQDAELVEQIVASHLRATHEAIGKARAEAGHTMAAVVSIMIPVTYKGEMRLLFANVGDAPIYRLRDGELKEITDFHTNLPPRSTDRPGLGKPDRPIPKTYIKRIQPGDKFILSSNGLRKNDADLKEMEKILTDNPDPQSAAEHLVADLPQLSRDSRTALVVRFAEAAHSQNR